MKTTTAQATDIQTLAEKAALVRKWCLISTTEAGSGHPTSCLSAADITTVLFDQFFTCDITQPLNLNNDRFVLSKGHAAPLLYTLFSVAGAYPPKDLKTLRQFGSRFEGHPTPNFAYAEAATGSLGQGLSVGAGLALVGKREKLPYRTFILTGDGELAEGQIWEAVNFASHEQLDNLVVIADINRLAQSGETMFGHDIDQYARRFEAFGFMTILIDGHNLEQIAGALFEATNNNNGHPTAIIASTIKGKGVSFLENKNGWHGKALSNDELQKALAELGDPDDALCFTMRKPNAIELPAEPIGVLQVEPEFEPDKSYATREVFGKTLTKLGRLLPDVYVLDGDVKNSTFTEPFMDAFPERFIECFIAEQNMVSVAAGLSRLGKVPVVATFGAFLSRAADQIRMARVSNANIKFVGSHVGVSIGEDGPSQMGLEDIAFFGATPDTVILQPSDVVSAAYLTAEMLGNEGMIYMRTLRPKTPVLYKKTEHFPIGGSKVLRWSEADELTILATGITVPEALKAADELAKQAVHVKVVDIYSINPIDVDMLTASLNETNQKLFITVEDHFTHGGMGDFVLAALAGITQPHRVAKLAVEGISRSGKSGELMDSAGISASRIVLKVKELLNL